MLTAATLGMAGYGLYSIAAALLDLIVRSRVEAWADVATAAFGLLLLLSAAFVRVQIPGGLALAIGALLGLQALSVHADAHTAVGLTLVPQLTRGGIAAALVIVAALGSRRPHKDVEGR